MLALSSTLKQTPYQALSSPLMVQTEVKRSKFLAYISPTQGAVQAKAFINKIKRLHPDASHNCWAYVASRPENTVDIGYSDDGEPSGCAGRPMLNVLQGSGIGEITVVVSRYFGGTKLGTGGMARAYAGAVSAVLAQAVTVEKAVLTELSFSCDYAWSNLVEQLITKYKAGLIQANYQATIDYHIEIDIRQAESFVEQLKQSSNGQICVVKSQP